MPSVAPHRKTVTLHHVAEAAGVSVMTVSRALSNPELVSARALEQVRQAVDATGYVPNLLAGGLKSQRSRTVGVLMPAIAVAQFLPTVQTLTEELDRAGYQVILGQAGYDHGREDALLDTFVGRRVDGIVVCGRLRSTAASQRLGKLEIPVVETWDLSDRPLDMLVGFSHMKVGSAVAGFFLDKGWRHAAIASGDDERAAARREGFLAAMGRDVPTVFVKAPGTVERGRAALSELLERHEGLRAVFCSSDGLAQGVLAEAQARGLSVPDDLAVVGFGDADFAAHLVPSLTTVHVDGAAIGRRAAQMIVERCRGDTVDEPILDVGFRIVQRQSTAT